MLGIYDEADPTTDFSVSGVFTNPLSFSVDGQTGATIARKLYLRNDDANFYYYNIQVQPTVNSGTDIVTGANGFSWKVLAGNTEPTEIQWGTVVAGAVTDLADIGSLGNGDITTYLPFWLRIDVPAGVDVQVFQNISLEIIYEEATA